jgi:iron complex outermembrane recepter protein
MNCSAPHAAAAKIQGGELEIQAIPIDDLKVTAQIGLTDARYTQIQAGVPFTIGDHFQNTPRWMTSLSGEYFVPVENGKLMGGRLDFVYRTTTYHEAVNTPESTQGSYGLLNGRLILKSAQDKWSVAVFATNILNKQYFTGAVDVLSSLGIAVVNPAPPRQGGVEASYRF